MQQIEKKKDHLNGLHEFKVPFSLPYPIYTSGYEETRGQIEWNGEFYVMTAQKLENDTLYIKAFKNTDRKQLDLAYADFTKASADAPSKDPAPHQLLKIIKDYDVQDHMQIHPARRWCRSLTYGDFLFSYFDLYARVLSPPPDHNNSFAVS